MEHAASSAAAAGGVRTRRTVLDLIPARVLARSIAYARERDACAFECVARCTAALAGLSSSATPPLVVHLRKGRQLDEAIAELVDRLPLFVGQDRGTFARLLTLQGGDLLLGLLQRLLKL